MQRAPRVSGRRAGPGVEFPDTLSHLLHRDQAALSRHLAKALGEQFHLVRSGAYEILVRASSHPGMPQKSLASELGMDDSNTAALVRRLERAGLIDRRRARDDHRRRGVFLTPDGVAQLASLRRDLHEAEQEFMSRHLGPGDREALIRLLIQLCVSI
jgi:DNA-binding MarR family transcriptional regulator